MHKNNEQIPDDDVGKMRTGLNKGNRQPANT